MQRRGKAFRSALRGLAGSDELPVQLDQQPMAAFGRVLCLCRFHFRCKSLLIDFFFFFLHMEAKRFIFCVLCLWMMERCYSL